MQMAKKTKHRSMNSPTQHLLSLTIEGIGQLGDGERDTRQNNYKEII